ncbi:MAG: PEGA domain-containing protein [Myxococcota bacterium]|nr:PEGA domain-containing protein [Myxococcota bacterium]
MQSARDVPEGLPEGGARRRGTGRTGSSWLLGLLLGMAAMWGGRMPDAGQAWAEPAQASGGQPAVSTANLPSPPSAAAEPTDPALLEPPPRLPTAVFAFEAAGVDPDLSQRLEDEMVAALRGHRRLALLDLRDVLDPVDPGLVALSQVQEMLEQARGLIESKRAAQADKILEQAVAILQRELGHVGRPEDVGETLREALGLQASAAFVQGDRPRALDLLQAIYNVNRRLRWVSRLFPESMKDFVEEARTRLLHAPRGGLVLGSTPGGAHIYLGGVKVGQGKVVQDSLPVGPHYVTWVRRYRRPLTSRVLVLANQSVELTPALSRYGADDPIARLEGAEALVGKSDMPLPFIEAAKALRAELLVLLRPQKQDSGSLRVSAYLYDGRLRTLRKQASQSINLQHPERDMPRLAAALLERVQLDAPMEAVAQAGTPPPAPRSNLQPQGKTRWFWPVFGVVFGAVVAAAATDIAVREVRR